MAARTWLRELRNELGAVQTEFADMLGLTQGTYSRIENGAHTPQDMVLFLEKVSAITGHSPFELYVNERLHRFPGADWRNPDYGQAYG